MNVVAAIDQGTTGTTVLLLDAAGRIVGRGYRELPQYFPAPGWVEHDPEDWVRTTVDALAEARAAAGDPEVVAVGLTNQRETTVLWERDSGRPVGRAIVWQDRRTQDRCAELRRGGHEEAVAARTGLLLDPYFSATKIAWLLEHHSGLRARAEGGEIAFGTVDSFLAFRLSGGRSHVTDLSNASRTLLFDLSSLDWSEELLSLFGVPRALLPRLVPSSGQLASLRGVPGLADGTPLCGMAGDQQAALFGQGCLAPGDAKCTYGTGAFLLMNVGQQAIRSRHRLLTSVAWQIDGVTTYALEGSAFVAGALVQWLRDGLGIIEKSADVEALAASVPDSGGVVIVPALAGLGAPHWRPEARGLIAGITRGTTRAHLARAALEAIALQIVELVAAMQGDSGRQLRALRVDGGATANNLLMQIQADLLGVEVLRPAAVEVTALGAARLAGQAIGFFDQTAGAAAGATTVTRFSPTLEHTQPGAGTMSGTLSGAVSATTPDGPRGLRARWREAVEKA
jgi:glycerol kinase